MVKKKKNPKKIKIDIGFLKAKGGPLVKGTRVGPTEIRKKLEATRMRTAKRILDNPFASPIQKARARRLLSQ